MAATTSGAPRRRAAAGPDRLTVVLLSIAAFLTVLSLMALQLKPTVNLKARRASVVRRVYQTTVVETVVGPATARGGSSVTQSVSSGGTSYSAAAAPTTRSS